MRIHSLPLAAPETGLSRLAIACLIFDFLLLALFWLLACWSPDAFEQGPRVELAVATWWDVDDGWHLGTDDKRLILSMTRDGRTWQGREPLNDLGEWLDRKVLAYDEKRRAEGKSGFEDFPGNALGSRLYVFLRIDRATRWGAVHEMLQRIGQRSLYKILVAASDGRRRFFLPAFLPTADEDGAYITARVRRVADGTSLSLDGRDVPDLTEAIEAAIRADHSAAGLIDADADVPFGDVVRALDAFACAGLEKVDLVADSVRAVVVPRPR